MALDYPQAKTVFDLNLAAWRERKNANACSKLDSQDSSGNEPGDRFRSRERLRQVVMADRARPPMWVREVRTGEKDGIWWAHRFGFSEPGIVIPMIELRAVALPPEAARRAPITVVGAPEGTTAVTQRPDWVRAIVAKTGRTLLFDPRGVGAAAQRPINGRPVDDLYGTLYKLNYDAMMLGDSLFAMQVFDCVRVLEYAHRISPSVSIEGERVAGLRLLAAAVIDGNVNGGHLTGLPRSYEELLTDRFFVPDYTLEVFGLTDLPDVPVMCDWLPQVTCTGFVDARGEPH